MTELMKLSVIHTKSLTILFLQSQGENYVNDVELFEKTGKNEIFS